MKRLLVLLFFIPFFSLAQVPQGVGYQGVATDANGIELVNQAISIKASVLSSSANGAIEWEETHATSTDTFGLFTLTIGQGTSTGNGVQLSFSDISWGTNTHYLKIEMDVTGGANYSFMGTNQMMSVPYALYAESANINYDSISNILSNDTTFITNVGGGMGGGCDWRFPDGLGGDPVIFMGYYNDYTVPVGKTLYITSPYVSSNSLISIDGIDIGTYLNANGGQAVHNPIVVNEGQIVGGEGNFHGLLFDNSIIEPITWQLPTSYTVPLGKELYILHQYGFGGASMAIDGVSIIGGANISGQSSFSLGTPIKLIAGQVVSSLYSSAFNGYLVEENYFAGCGGGSSTIINYDSLANIISMDSTFISNVGSGMGGGCNFKFPEGLDGEGINVDLSNITYTVPAGKRLYVTNYYDSGTGIWIDGVAVHYNGDIASPIIVDEGQIISTAYNTLLVTGYLVTPSIDLDAINMDLSNITYTVPVGQRLYVTNYYDGGTGIWIDGVSVHYNGGITSPIIVNEGQIISTAYNILLVNGYLVDENYFAGCGGASSIATSNTINYMPGGFLQNPYEGDFMLVEQDIQPGNTFTYVVPSGKNLMIDGISGYWANIMTYLYYNNYPYFNPITNQDLPLTDVPLMEGDSLVFENTGNVSQNIIFYGNLIDVDPSIEIVHIDLSSGQTYTVPSGKKLITSDVWSDNCLGINLTLNGNTSFTSNTFPENVKFLSPGISISVNYDITQSPNFYYLFGTLIND